MRASTGCGREGCGAERCGAERCGGDGCGGWRWALRHDGVQCTWAGFFGWLPGVRERVVGGRMSRAAAGPGGARSGGARSGGAWGCPPTGAWSSRVHTLLAVARASTWRIPQAGVNVRLDDGVDRLGRPEPNDQPFAGPYIYSDRHAAHVRSLGCGFRTLTPGRPPDCDRDRDCGPSMNRGLLGSDGRARPAGVGDALDSCVVRASSMGLLVPVLWSRIVRSLPAPDLAHTQRSFCYVTHPGVGIPRLVTRTLRTIPIRWITVCCLHPVAFTLPGRQVGRAVHCAGTGPHISAPPSVYRVGWAGRLARRVSRS